MEVKTNLTLDEAIDQVGKKLTLNESIADDGVNNMDLSEVDDKTELKVDVPYNYAYAIKDHKRRLARNRELFKDKYELVDEMVKENSRDSHNKVVKNDSLKKLKLSESFFEDLGKDYRTKFGDATVYNDEEGITISWYSSSVNSTIKDAEQMIKDLQEAVEFARNLRKNSNNISEKVSNLNEMGRIAGTPSINLLKYGFVRAPEEDFSDDGDRFIVYYFDPEKKGDKRVKLSKTTGLGEVYLSASYYNEETGKYTYFDDLNGVDTHIAIEGLPKLVSDIKAFLDKVDRGEEKAIQITDDQIEEIIDRTIKSGSDNHYAWKDAAKAMGINADRLPSIIQRKIEVEIQRRKRNAKKFDPSIINALAKEALDWSLRMIKAESKYNPYKKTWETRKAISPEDVIYKVVDSYDVKVDDPDNKYSSIYLKDLPDEIIEKITAWVAKKLASLYDFE